MEFNFYQKKAKVDKEIIENKHWGNIENRDTEINNVSNNIKTKKGKLKIIQTNKQKCRAK